MKFPVDLHVISLTLLSMTSIIYAKIKDDQRQDLTFELPDNDNICFYEEFTGAKVYILEYNVLAGGANDVDATVTSPNGKVLYKESKRKSDSFSFETSRGVYSFCFSNEFSTFTHKVVWFSLGAEMKRTLAEEGGDEKPTVNTQAENALEEIYEAAIHVEGYQNEYRLNEARGRHMAENLCQRVQWWSALESCIIMFTGISQVVVLRAFFTHKRTNNKMPTTDTQL